MDPAVIDHPAVLALADKYEVAALMDNPDLYLSERAHYFPPEWLEDAKLIEYAVTWAKKKKKQKGKKKT